MDGLREIPAAVAAAVVHLRRAIASLEVAEAKALRAAASPDDGWDPVLRTIVRLREAKASLRTLADAWGAGESLLDPDLQAVLRGDEPPGRRTGP